MNTTLLCLIKFPSYINFNENYNVWRDEFILILKENGLYKDCDKEIVINTPEIYKPNPTKTIKITPQPTLLTS
jgi:hypothetical protein